jgi:hypothetical protein
LTAEDHELGSYSNKPTVKHPTHTDSIYISSLGVAAGLPATVFGRDTNIMSRQMDFFDTYILEGDTNFLQPVAMLPPWS